MAHFNRATPPPSKQSSKQSSVFQDYEKVLVVMLHAAGVATQHTL